MLVAVIVTLTGDCAAGAVYKPFLSIEPEEAFQVTPEFDVPVTVAVKVTELPVLEGFAEEASVVVVAAVLTTWLTTLDVLPVKLELPP